MAGTADREEALAGACQRVPCRVEMQFQLGKAEVFAELIHGRIHHWCIMRLRCCRSFAAATNVRHDHARSRE